jgi:hypothetical protein
MALKPCKVCGRDISSTAEKCPYCAAPVKFKMPKIGIIGILGILGAALFFAMMVMSLFSDKKADSSTSSDVAAIGEEARIYSGSKSTPLATTKDYYDELLKIVLAKDWAGLRQMIILERAFVVDEGTRVLVIDKNWNWTTAQVRVLAGSQAGKEGWVSHEYLKRRRD